MWGAGGWRGLAPGGPDVRSGEGAGPRWAPPGVGGQEGQGGGARMSCLQTPGPRPATRRGPCRPPARCSPGASSTSEGAGHGGGRGSRAQVGMVRPDGLRVEPWWPRAPDAPTARPFRAPPARAARTPLRAARSPTQHRDGGRIAEGASPASAPCRPPDHRNCSARPRARLRGGLPAPLVLPSTRPSGRRPKPRHTSLATLFQNLLAARCP